MRLFVLKRILQGLFVLFGLSVVVFCISHIVPGDPARMALGSSAPQYAVDALRKAMHYDRPLYIQYYYWVEGVLTGNLGTSLVTKRPVLQDIKEVLPASVELVLMAATFVAAGGIVFGTLAAHYRDRWPDTVIRMVSYTAVAIPSFVLAVLLLLFFGYVWPVIPVLGRLGPQFAVPPHVTGLYVIDGLLSGHIATAWDATLHLLAPAVALAAGPMFQEARIVRSAMTENAAKDYLSVARGYGIPRRVITGKYLLKPSLIPAISVMGLDIAALMGNAFLIELIFAWPGISRYGMTAMLRKDLSAIAATIVVFGTAFVVMNLLVDVIVSYLDPRIRMGRKA